MDRLDIRLCRHYIGMTEEFWDEGQRGLERCLQDRQIREEFGQLAHTLMEKRDPSQGAQILERMQRRAEQTAPEFAPVLPAAALGALLPRAVAYLRQIGAEEAVICRTFGDMQRWIRRYTRLHGKPGVDELGWIVLPYTGGIFEIGSLQYQIHRMTWPVHLWRMADGGLRLLADSGVCVASDGFITGTNGAHFDTAFVTQYEEDDQCFRGYCYDAATGLVSDQMCAFAKSEGDHLLWPGRTVLNLHIPENADLSAEAVAESMEKAKAFFEKLGVPCDIVVCFSWLLDPQLAQWLKPESKILRFAAGFARFQAYCPESWAHRFLFGVDTPPERLTPADAKTGLQKAVLNHWRQGGKLYDTGGIMALDQQKSGLF